MLLCTGTVSASDLIVQEEMSLRATSGLIKRFRDAVTRYVTDDDWGATSRERPPGAWGYSAGGLLFHGLEVKRFGV